MPLIKMRNSLLTQHTGLPPAPAITALSNRGGVNRPQRPRTMDMICPMSMLLAFSRICGKYRTCIFLAG